jgi:hypothetical protein
MRKQVKVLAVALILGFIVAATGCKRCSKCVCEKRGGCIFEVDSLNPLYSPDTLSYRYTECLYGNEPSPRGGGTRYNELVNSYGLNCK